LLCYIYSLKCLHQAPWKDLFLTDTYEVQTIRALQLVVLAMHQYNNDLELQTSACTVLFHACVNRSWISACNHRHSCSRTTRARLLKRSVTQESTPCPTCNDMLRFSLGALKHGARTRTQATGCATRPFPRCSATFKPKTVIPPSPGHPVRVSPDWKPQSIATRYETLSTVTVWINGQRACQLQEHGWGGEFCRTCAHIPRSPVCTRTTTEFVGRCFF